MNASEISLEQKKQIKISSKNLAFFKASKNTNGRLFYNDFAKYNFHVTSSRIKTHAYGDM